MERVPDPIEVRDNTVAQRYEVEMGGQTAVLEYRREPGRITLIHTGVPQALEGHGIAAALARTALDDARASGLAVVPRCPYVQAYIRRHPDYASLVSRGEANATPTQ